MNTHYAICVDNTNHEASLEKWKIYRTLPDQGAAQHHHLRVIDESGEDYLFPERCFIFIELPDAVHERLNREMSPLP